MKKLLIYIPTFNRLHSLRKCIDLISKNIQSFERYVEIIVSDNQSTDGTWEYLESLSFSYLIIKRNTSNIGLTLNVLKVFEFQHRAEFTWIIGDDDYLMDESISRLLEEINRNPEVDFYFVNTLSFPDKNRDKALKTRGFSLLNYFLLGARLHSKISSDFSCRMQEIINPEIDHTLGGALMCYVFRSKLIVDSISEKLFNSDFSQAEACYPHTLCFYNSLTPLTKSRHLHLPFTYNIWHKGEDWGSDGYDLAVTQGLGLLYIEACRLGYIKDQNKYKYFRSYMNISQVSFERLIYKYKDLPFSAQFSKVFLATLLTFYYKDRRSNILSLSYIKSFLRSIINYFK